MENVKYPSWLNRKSKIRITWIFFWAWNGMNFLNNTTFKIFKNYLSRISRILEFVKSKQRNMPRRQVRRWMRFMFSLFVNKARMMIFTIDLNLDRFFDETYDTTDKPPGVFGWSVVTLNHVDLRTFKPYQDMILSKRVIYNLGIVLGILLDVFHLFWVCQKEYFFDSNFFFEFTLISVSRGLLILFVYFVILLNLPWNSNSQYHNYLRWDYFSAIYTSKHRKWNLDTSGSK